MCRLSYARTVGRSPHWDLMFALRPAAATLPANAGVTPAAGPQLAADARCDDTPPCERPPPSPCCLLCAYLLVYIHLFPANLGGSACISEIVQAISAVRHFGGRSGIIRRAVCRNWLHFYRIPCRVFIIGRKKV